MTNGLPSASGCSSFTLRMNATSAAQTDSIVWPGTGCGIEHHEVAGVPGLSAMPISLSILKPPMPGPCPARGSITTNGRFFGSAAG